MPGEVPDLDLDFKIYVDPSCLSEPMDEEIPKSQEVPPSTEEVHEQPAMAPEGIDEIEADGETKDAEQPIEDGAGGAAEEQQEQEPSASTDDLTGSEPTPEQDSLTTDASTEEQSTADAQGAAPETAEMNEDMPAAEEAPVPDEAPTAAPESPPENAADSEPSPAAEPEAVPEPQQTEESSADEPTDEPEEPKADHVDEASAETQTVNDATAEQQDHLPEAQLEEVHEGHQNSTAAEDTTSATADSQAEEDQEPATQPPNITERKTSLRTEALIQAAARAVVAKIEKRKSQEAPDRDEDDDFDNSLLSTDSQDTYMPEEHMDARSTYSGHHSPARRESSGSQVRHIPSRSASSIDTGDSSSHHEPEDDMFSDRSARSSLCSLDGHDDVHAAKTPQAKENLSRRESFASSRQSPRAVSGLSMISGLSQYDKEPFVPTSRETRMPFRTPSEIRAMQLASPTPSVFNGSSPRSSKRQSTGGGFPSISRVGSPTVSAQYSPKGRSTPPRFKSRKEAPLVLLHVTLLPLRWVWGDVLNGLDAVTTGKSLDGIGGSQPFEPSEQLKALRDAWRELQDRVGDTVLERGILLPHPQNDYEVLEERLLESLELPLRRRARILECGHYLGPANEMGDEEAEYSDDEYASQSGRAAEEKRHWCNTCRNEIKYEQLGPGKVFRVKVYASNGLMKAGAWEACWKEMERVDVELEPIVDAALQNELEKLGALQLELEEQRQQQLQQQQQDGELERTAEPEADLNRVSSPAPAPTRAETLSRQQQQLHQQAERPSTSGLAHQGAMMSSPLPAAMQFAPALASSSRPSSRQTEPIDTSEERRRRDEERMREVYGDAAAPVEQYHAPSSPQQQPPTHPQVQMPAQPQPQPQSQSQALTLAPQPPFPHQYPPPPTPHQHPHSSHPHAAHPGYHHQHHYPQDHHADGYDDRKPQQPRNNNNSNHNNHNGRQIVLDENSGFVELLMEAFKVLLRDPKNVAIIVLCVFVVVMIKRPGGGGAGGNTALEVVSSPGVNANNNNNNGGGHGIGAVGVGIGAGIGVVGVGGDGNGNAVAGVSYQRLGLGQGDGVGEGVPVAQVPVHVSVSEQGPARSAEAAGKDVLVEVVSPPEVESSAAEVPEAREPVPAAVEMTMSEIESKPASEPEPDPEVAEASSEPVMEAAEVATAAKPELPADACSMADLLAVWALQYPTSGLQDYLYVAEAAATEEENNVHPGECAGPEADEDDNVSEQAVLFSAAEEEGHDHASCDISTTDDDDDDDEDEDEEATSTASHSLATTTSLFIPGPFVTERKTVRVFETVTETVRVSVVTQTETVSTVVTAVPQTVEETVYETETVRITVSVPVEERDKAVVKEGAKEGGIEESKKEREGKKEGKKAAGKKGKGFCGGWL
ncbi:hypothetical protein VTK26DRAFT_54 [Humicola hyalothermophila]